MSAAAEPERLIDPASLGATEAMRGATYVAVVDVFALVFMFLVLAFGCDAANDGARQLSLLHLVHAFAIVVPLVTCCFDVLVVPLFLMVVASLVALVDVFVLVQRSVIVFSGDAIEFECGFALWVFDLVFLALACSYFLYGTVSLSRFRRYYNKIVVGPGFVALIDALLIVLTFAIVIFWCGGGAYVANETSRLSALHATHLALMIAACIVFQVDALLIPAFFVLLALAVLGVDGYVLYVRSRAVFGGGLPATFGCEILLWFLDVGFVITAGGYLLFAVQAAGRFGLCGNPDDETDPFAPREPPPAEAESIEAPPDYPPATAARTLAAALNSGGQRFTKTTKTV